MNNSDIYVVELKRRTKSLFRGSLGACARFITDNAAPGMTRLALVISARPPDDGPDAAVCVPAVSFGAWEERGAHVVASWELKWGILADLPTRYRDEARADLLQAVASALVASAINGVDSMGRPDELAF